MHHITDDDVLNILRPDMDKARAYQAELSQEREKFYRWYRAEPYGNERPGWSQTIHPTIFSAVEWMKPGLVEVFIGDFFSLTPVPRDSDPAGRRDARDAAARLKRYVRHKLFNQQDGEQLIEDFIHDCLVGHYGVMKVTQREDFDLVTETLPEMTTEAIEALVQGDPSIVDVRGGRTFTRPDPDTGAAVSGLDGAKAVRKKPRYQGFHLEVVPARELYMLPGYPDLEKNPFVAHVVKRDLDHIRRQELAGVYRKGSFDKARARLDERRATEDTFGEYAAYHASDNLTAPEAAVETDSPLRLGAGEVFVWECYTRLAIDDTGLLKPCIVTLCEDVVLRGPVENPYGGPPFELGSIYKEPHKTVGRPVAAVLDQRQRVLSNLLRNIQDAAALSTYRGWLTTDARSKRILAGMGPGDVSLVPTLGVVQEIVPQPSDPMTINAFNLTLQEVAKESGVNENMQGLDNNSLNQTAAGMQMRLSAGMQRQRLYARRLARAFRRVLGRVLDIIRLYPPTDDQRIVGTDVAVAPDDARGEYTVTIDVGVGPQDRQANAQTMDQLIQLMLKAGFQLGICDPKDLIKAVKAKYEFLDIDVSEYLLTEEQFDERRRLEERIKQLEGENAGLSQAIAEHAQKLRAEAARPGVAGKPSAGPAGGPVPGPVPGSGQSPAAVRRRAGGPPPAGAPLAAAAAPGPGGAQ